MEDKVYYVGANKLEYATRDDADVYGGGAVAIKRVSKEVVVPLEAITDQEIKATAPVAQEEALIREVGKSKGIRGWAVMPVKRLQEKIDALSIEENSNK